MRPSTQHVDRDQTDEDLELPHVGPENERVAGKHCERQSQVDQAQWSLNKVLQIEADPNKSLPPVEMPSYLTKETEIEHHCCLHVSHKLESISSCD